MHDAVNAPGSNSTGRTKKQKTGFAHWRDAVAFGRELLEHLTGAGFRLLHTIAYLEACEKRNARAAGRPLRAVWARQGPTGRQRWSYNTQRASKSLAELCGISRQHVCITLAALECFGLVEVLGGEVDPVTGKRKQLRDRANRFTSHMYRLTARARSLLRLNDRAAPPPEKFRVMDTPHGILGVPVFSSRASGYGTLGGSG